MRSRAKYHAAHIFDSVSFPVDLCDERFFVGWDPERIMREIIKNKEKYNLFKNRKRQFISIIAGCEDIQSMLEVLPMIYSYEKMRNFKECPQFKGRRIAIEDVRHNLNDH
jgi:hypothetical protein